MKRAKRFFGDGSSRTWQLLAGLIMQAASAAVAFACAGLQGGTIGNPSPPRDVLLDETYYITVTCTTVLPCHPSVAYLYSSNSPTGPWTYKGGKPMSGSGTYGERTFSVKNSAPGYYWWRGQVQDTGATTAWGNVEGYYHTIC